MAVESKAALAKPVFIFFILDAASAAVTRWKYFGASKLLEENCEKISAIQEARALARSVLRKLGLVPQ